MSKQVMRQFELFWVLCWSIIVYVLTAAYAQASETAAAKGSNPYDVMISGRDIGIVAVILALFMASVVTITVLNNKSIGRLAGSIDTMKDALTATNFTNAQSVHNMLQTLAAKPCFAEELIKDSLKAQLLKDIRREDKKGHQS